VTYTQAMLTDSAPSRGTFACACWLWP